MRNLIFLFSLLFLGCKGSGQNFKPADSSAIVQAYRIVPVPAAVTIFDSCSYYRKQRDTATHKLYMANQKINAAVFYIKCVKKKPQNKKFFWNWMTTRAMVEHPIMDITP